MKIKFHHFFERTAALVVLFVKGENLPAGTAWQGIPGELQDDLSPTWKQASKTEASTRPRKRLKVMARAREAMVHATLPQNLIEAGET